MKSTITAKGTVILLAPYTIYSQILLACTAKGFHVPFLITQDHTCIVNWCITSCTAIRTLIGKGIDPNHQIGWCAFRKLNILKVLKMVETPSGTLQADVDGAMAIRVHMKSISSLLKHHY